MKKYIPVFGPQELFKGVPEYVEFIRFNDYSREYLWGDSKSINHLTAMDLKAIPIVAMRRIVRTPTWTVADQKAGKLPMVGAKFLYKNEELCCHYVDSNGEIWANNFKGEVVTPLLREITPIESPEGKAARLRKEWCDKAAKTLKNLEYSSTLTSIYDALLSGDLPVPVKGE